MVDNRWGRLYWFVNPGKPADGHWKQHVITTKCPHAYDVVLSDLDGDGDLDAASSGFCQRPDQLVREPRPERGPDGEWRIT
ncbi:MAG: hypothetical protein Ct9H300mP1_25820 [Planctomycetaceae bacterium]|nr:MAG: hypothetical protein Ct9H300mP1_25820 [Planctomycetaceae bacterium]